LGDEKSGDVTAQPFGKVVAPPGVYSFQLYAVSLGCSDGIQAVSCDISIIATFKDGHSETLALRTFKAPSDVSLGKGADLLPMTFGGPYPLQNLASVEFLITDNPSAMLVMDDFECCVNFTSNWAPGSGN
jgi:hypothetical protein